MIEKRGAFTRGNDVGPYHADPVETLKMLIAIPLGLAAVAAMLFVGLVFLAAFIKFAAWALR